MIRPQGAQHVCALFFPAIALIAIASCDRYAHGLHQGTLADVATPELYVYVWEGKPVLAISNTGKDNACLQLSTLVVRVDGVMQTQVYQGGRNSGETKGNIGPVNKTDSCDAARADIVQTKDVTRATNIVEVTDGTTTLRAEFPNIFSETTWKVPPPPTVKVGTTFHAVIAPPAPHGSGPNDSENYLGAMIDDGTYDPGHHLAKVPLRPGPDGAIDIDLPATTPTGKFRLYVSSSEILVPALSCTASSCRGASAFVITADITIAP